MADLLEIRWHGRGGQGAKTASILLAKLVAAMDKYVQAFPEYGPERMGAPVLAYNRIDEERIRQHCQIENPDIVIVLDPTLIGTVDITAGLMEDGDLIINSDKDPAQLKQELGAGDDINLYCVSANKISEEEIGRVFPNTPMLGAFNGVTKMLAEENFFQGIEEQFNKKFGKRKEIIEGNMKAVKRAYREVKGI